MKSVYSPLAGASEPRFVKGVKPLFVTFSSRIILNLGPIFEMQMHQYLEPPNHYVTRFYATNLNVKDLQHTPLTIFSNQYYEAILRY